MLLSLGLLACGGSETQTPGAATQRGVDRSVADIRAAEAAAAKPVEVSRSVGELTGKAAAVEGPEDAGAESPPGKSAPAAG